MSYHFVDFFKAREDGNNQKWQRVEAKTIEEISAKQGSYATFASIQQYKNKQEKDNEEYIMPLFFDFDSTDLEIARQDTLEVLRYLMIELEIPKENILIYFSGSKGFHLIIKPEVFTIKPASDLNKKMKYIVSYIKKYLQITKEKEINSLDLVVYSKKRVLRIPNSIHEKTKLHKIYIEINELENNIEYIKKKAEKINDDHTYSEVVKPGKLVDKATEFWQKMIFSYEEFEKNKTFDTNDFNFKIDRIPVCINDLLENGWKQDGQRNEATIHLATYFRDAGKSNNEAFNILRDWVIKFSTAKNYELDKRLISTRVVIDQIYDNPDYKFGCSYIRSLGIPGNSIKCAGNLCEHVIGNNEEDAVEIDLYNSIKASNSRKLVKTNVIVAGRRNTPYIVPKEVEYVCWGKSKCSITNCPLFYANNNTGKINITKERELIEMTGVNDSIITQVLRKLSKIPESCKKYQINILDNSNIEEILTIPVLGDETKYVVRKSYIIDDIDIEENNQYQIIGWVYPHPKTQEGTILIHKANPVKSRIDDFKLNVTNKKLLENLQPEQWNEKSIALKIDSIIDFLSNNVAKIVERDELILSILLTYFSPLRINTPWENNTRGWLETVIIGDTGTAKSKALKNIIEYFQLGNSIDAESSSRTGLTYKLEQLNGAWYIMWGKYPLSDKELLWIDECTGIDKEEYGHMTNARSTGTLKVDRAVSAETNCRTRLILTGNAPKGNTLSDYSQGVEVLDEIFKNEDIRRFDIGIFLKASDVKESAYNKILEELKSNIYNQELFKTAILFSWSRKPEDIIFSKTTNDKIQEVSEKMSKTYGKARKIPLVHPAEQKLKIARCAAALALLTNSLDQNGNILVRVCHVEYIYDYLSLIYDSPACGLNFYAQKAGEQDDITDAQFDKLYKDFLLKDIIKLRDPSTFQEFILLFNKQTYLSYTDIENMLDFTRDDTKTLINVLTKTKCINKTSGGFRKTPRFNSFISLAYAKGLMKNSEIDLLD